METAITEKTPCPLNQLISLYYLFDLIKLRQNLHEEFGEKRKHRIPGGMNEVLKGRTFNKSGPTAFSEDFSLR